MSRYDLYQVVAVKNAITHIEQAQQVSIPYLKRLLDIETFALFRNVQPLAAFNKFMSTRNVDKAIAALNKILVTMRGHYFMKKDLDKEIADILKLSAIRTELLGKIETALINDPEMTNKFLDHSISVDAVVWKSDLIKASECPMTRAIHEASQSSSVVMMQIQQILNGFNEEDVKRSHYERTVMKGLIEDSYEDSYAYSVAFREVLSFEFNSFLLENAHNYGRLLIHCEDAVGHKQHPLACRSVMLYLQFQDLMLTRWITQLRSWVWIVNAFFLMREKELGDTTTTIDYSQFNPEILAGYLKESLPEDLSAVAKDFLENWESFYKK